jgi:hypothetical protein
VAVVVVAKTPVVGRYQIVETLVFLREQVFALFDEQTRGAVELHTQAAVGLFDGQAKTAVELHTQVAVDLAERVHRVRPASFTVGSVAGLRARVSLRPFSG